MQNTVPRLMKTANFTGYYTNHSLRVSAATRLFNSGVDEQAIMCVTGHSSTDGVRAYKRMSEKLKELTSDVLNQGGEAATLPKKQKLDGEGKENLSINVAQRLKYFKACVGPSFSDLWRVAHNNKRWLSSTLTDCHQP